MWSIADVADALARGIEDRAREFDLEQTVRGVDSLDELTLHPILADAIARYADVSVHRELRYPADRDKRARSAGERCDLVLGPREAVLVGPDDDVNLFKSAEREVKTTITLDEALWIEVKVVAQFHSPGGVLKPNANYAGQLLSTVRRDVTKLSKDGGILHAAVALVLFVADSHVADNDLRVWQDRCLERGLPIGSPCRRDVRVADRIGHGVCAVAVYPVSHY